MLGEERQREEERERERERDRERTKGIERESVRGRGGEGESPKYAQLLHTPTTHHSASLVVVQVHHVA